MRYAPTYNAPGFKWYQSQYKDTKLTIIDLILLNEINELSRTWVNINTKVFFGKKCFNISYSKLIEQLPGINITTTDGMSKRLKKGLIEEKLLKRYIDRSDNSKIYFTLTELGNTINSYQANEHNQTDKQPSTSQTNDREPPGRTTVSHPDERPTNKSINNKNIKNKRESTHFDFLNKNYSDEVKSVFKKYSLCSDQKKYCINKFNKKRIQDVNPVDLESFVGNWWTNLNNKDNDSGPRVADIKFS